MVNEKIEDTFRHTNLTDETAAYLAKREELAEPVGRRLAAQTRHSEQRLDLGGEDQPTFRLRPIEWAHPETIADERQSLSLPVPEGRSEAPVERGQKPWAFAGETLRQQLDHRVAREVDAVTDKMRSSIPGCVELAVEGQRHGVPFGEAGRSRVERDRAQPCMPVARDPRVRVLPRIVFLP